MKTKPKHWKLIRKQKKLSREGKYNKFRETRKETKILRNRNKKLIKNNRMTRSLRDEKHQIISLKEEKDRKSLSKWHNKDYANIYKFIQIKNTQYWRYTTRSEKERNADSEETDEEEIQHALQATKNHRAPEDDNILTEMLKEGENWNNAVVLILYKKETKQI